MQTGDDKHGYGSDRGEGVAPELRNDRSIPGCIEGGLDPATTAIGISNRTPSSTALLRTKGPLPAGSHEAEQRHREYNR